MNAPAVNRTLGLNSGILRRLLGLAARRETTWWKRVHNVTTIITSRRVFRLLGRKIPHLPGPIKSRAVRRVRPRRCSAGGLRLALVLRRDWETQLAFSAQLAFSFAPSLRARSLSAYVNERDVRFAPRYDIMLRLVHELESLHIHQRHPWDGRT